MVAAITLLSGCVPSSSVGSLSQNQVNSVIKKLDCDELVEFKTDLFSDDGMIGFDCRFNDRESLMFRQYDLPTTVGKNIEDWIPLVSENNKLVWNTNWFAIGNPQDLSALTQFEALEGAQQIPKIVKKTNADFWMQDCGAYVVTSVSGKFGLDTSPTSNLSKYEVMVPGLTEWLSNSKSLQSPEIQSAIKDRDLSKVIALLSEPSSGAKDLCEAQKSKWDN